MMPPSGGRILLNLGIGLMNVCGWPTHGDLVRASEYDFQRLLNTGLSKLVVTPFDPRLVKTIP